MTLSKHTPFSFALLFALCTHTAYAADPPEPIFEVVSLSGTVDGQGFAGTVGNEDLWTASVEATSFDEFPIAFEELAFGPLGGSSYGMAALGGQLVPTGVVLAARTFSSSDGGEEQVDALTWSQVHGMLVLDVQEEALLEYAFSTTTAQMDSVAYLRLQKADGAGWEELVNQTSLSQMQEETNSGEMTIEPGTYRLIFYAVANTEVISMYWPETEAYFEAAMRITSAPEPEYNADINGDGKVNGEDLARLLGAWGSSAGGGDINGDGTVDGEDLAILLGAWTG